MALKTVVSSRSLMREYLGRCLLIRSTSQNGSSVSVSVYSHSKSGTSLLANMAIKPNGLITMQLYSDGRLVSAAKNQELMEAADVTRVPL